MIAKNGRYGLIVSLVLLGLGGGAASHEDLILERELTGATSV